MHGSTSYFSHARTALKYGLISLNISTGDKVLMPEYICEVVLHPLEDLGIQPVYYPIDDSFAPDWDAIDNIQTKEKANAFILVHYFGQPQDIERARIFCDKNGLWFIEDNAHGHGGTLNSQPLGSFGDLGFSSPRKQLQSSSGGILYLHGKHVEPHKEELQGYPVSDSKEKLRNLIRSFPRFKARLRRWLRAEPDFSDPFSFPEVRIGDFKADSYSERMIITENWHKHAKSCPWVMPVYTNNQDDRIKWLHWGWKTGIDLFPWPTLPEKVLQKSPESTVRWKHLLCFPLHQNKENNTSCE